MLEQVPLLIAHAGWLLAIRQSMMVIDFGSAACSHPVRADQMIPPVVALTLSMPDRFKIIPDQAVV
jgi:hypothetical protein